MNTRKASLHKSIGAVAAALLAASGLVATATLSQYSQTLEHTNQQHTESSLKGPGSHKPDTPGDGSSAKKPTLDTTKARKAASDADSSQEKKTHPFHMQFEKDPLYKPSLKYDAINTADAAISCDIAVEKITADLPVFVPAMRDGHIEFLLDQFDILSDYLSPLELDREMQMLRELKEVVNVKRYEERINALLGKQFKTADAHTQTSKAEIKQQVSNSVVTEVRKQCLATLAQISEGTHQAGALQFPNLVQAAANRIISDMEQYVGGASGDDSTCDNEQSITTKKLKFLCLVVKEILRKMHTASVIIQRGEPAPATTYTDRLIKFVEQPEGDTSKFNIEPVYEGFRGHCISKGFTGVAIAFQLIRSMEQERSAQDSEITSAVKQLKQQLIHLIDDEASFMQKASQYHKDFTSYQVFREHEACLTLNDQDKFMAALSTLDRNHRIYKL